MNKKKLLIMTNDYDYDKENIKIDNNTVAYDIESPRFNESKINLEAIKQQIKNKLEIDDEETNNYVLNLRFNPKNIDQNIPVHSRRFYINVYNPPVYKSRIYIDDGVIIKVYNYDCDNMVEKCDSIIINEIASQIYADKYLKCNIKIPKIFNYGKIENPMIDEDYPYNTFFFIIMENISPYIQLGNLKNKNLTVSQCDMINKSVLDATKCLIDSGFNHNDLHNENIFIDLENIKNVGLIDFGKTSIGSPSINLGEVPKTYKCGNLNYGIGDMKNTGGTKRRTKRSTKRRKNSKRKGKSVRRKRS